MVKFNFSFRQFVLFLSVFFVLLGVCVRLSSMQMLLINCASLYKGRSLNYQFWKNFLNSVSIKFFIISFVFFLYYFCTSKRCQLFYFEHQNKITVMLCVSFSIAFFLLFFLPFILYGKDSVVTVFDNLDCFIPIHHYIRKNHLFFCFNRHLPVMDGISTLFLNRDGFYFWNMIYCFLPDYVSYIVNNVLCGLFGFFCMFYFQKELFKNEDVYIIFITSAAYALLPVCLSYRMSVATLPIAPVLFCKLLKSDKKRWLVLSFIYPFLSEFSSVGIFVCGLWFLGLIVDCIRYKVLNKRLFMGFVLVCIGFLFCISGLIYARFLISEPLNRDFFSTPPALFFDSFKSHLVVGVPHAATLQTVLVNQVIAIVGFAMLYCFLRNRPKTKNYYELVLLLCLFVCLFCSLIAALADAKIIKSILKVFIPFLAGFDFSRIYTIARVALYIAFSTCLLWLVSKKKAAFAYFLSFMQIVVIFNANAFYNDSKTTWIKHLDKGDGITWNEFFSEKQFEQIKKTICYSGERVCAVGYHPSVLLYNDFNTIDGYLSIYPYKDQVKWHELMQPEFDRNQDAMQYFDSWGGRRYIYNMDIDYWPTRVKQHDGVNLFVNMDLLKNHYKCKYILSRVELKNAAEVGLENIGVFDSAESIYIIWVYKIQ